MVVGLLFLIVFPLVGGLMVFFTCRHRWRKSRVLARGRLLEGKISDVQRSDVTVNNQIRHHVCIDYAPDGTRMTGKCNASGIAAKMARSLLESGQPVKVLVDPHDSTHIVCPDLVMVWEQLNAP